MEANAVRRRELVTAYDRSGLQVSDPSAALNRAYGLSWRTGLPGGFLDCSFMVPLALLREWAVKEAYTIRVWDGGRLMFVGILEDLMRSINLPNSLGRGTRQVTAFGFYVNVVQRSYTGVHAADDGNTIIQTVLGNCPLVSVDYSLVTGLDRNLGAIEWTDTPVSDVIRDVVDFGDNATPPETFWFGVWDGTLSSDGLPQGQIHKYDVSDYDLQIPLSAISGSIGISRTLENVSNYVTAKYGPLYTAAAQDATSQTDFGIRDTLLQAGDVDLATAQAMRDRYLEYRRTVQDQLANIRLSSSPLTKAGAVFDMNRVRAGMRFVIPQLRLQWDQIYWIASTDYDTDSRTLGIAIGERTQKLVPRDVVIPDITPGPGPKPVIRDPDPWIEPWPRRKEPDPVPRRT